MERSSGLSTKRKIKKEPLPGGHETNMKKPIASKEQEETNGPLAVPDYPCISPETVTVIAESIGISNVGDDIATNLAEDVSYKLQEIITASCTIMRKSKRRKLLLSDVNSAFRISDVHHIFGHLRKDPFKFMRLSDGELFIAADSEVDLISVAFNPSIPKLKRPSYVTSSYPVLQGMLSTSMNGHNIKTEEKSATHHSKSLINGDISAESLSTHLNFFNDGTYHFSEQSQVLQVLKQNDQSKKMIEPLENGTYYKPVSDSSLKLNGAVRLSHLSGVRQKLKRDSEAELKFSKAQLSYFSVMAKCIVEGPDSLFQQALTTLRCSRKVDIMSAPLLNFIALTSCRVPRHFSLLTRLLETVEVLLCNVNISPTFCLAVNRLVNALLAITADQNILRSQNDFLLRRRAAQLLTRVLLVWGIEEQHVSELLSRVARVLGDPKEKNQSHFGALVIFQSLGKAAIGWLSPLLKCFLPILERRFPHTSVTSSIHMEEIRGVLLDIVELLNCDVNLHRLKIKASTLQETQAMIQLDTLLYHYCGDAVCARRRPCVFQSRQTKEKQICFENSLKNQTESRLWQQTLNFLSLRYVCHYPQKLKQSQVYLDIFEEACSTPILKRKDIHFRFAGANPVPKDGLRKKVLDKTHVLFRSLSNSQLHSIFPRQHLMVGHLQSRKLKALSKQASMPYSLLNVL